MATKEKRSQSSVTLLKNKKQAGVVDKKKVFDSMVNEFATNDFAAKNLNLDVNVSPFNLVMMWVVCRFKFQSLVGQLQVRRPP